MKKTSIFWLHWLSVFLCFCMLFPLVGCAAKDTPELDESIPYASVVEIHINPSFRVYLDADQTVLQVECLNEDAKKVCEDLDFSAKSFDEAFSEILEESANEGFLTDGKTVDVQVIRNVTEDVYAPDIAQNAREIAQEIITHRGIAADVTVEISREIVEEQAQDWQQDDIDTFAQATDTAEEMPEDTDTDTDAPQADHTCETCNGTGVVSCDTCEGHGELSCVDCNATGTITRDCEFCENGLTECDYCHGEGGYTCESCGGDGLLEGQCSSCGGTGKCVNCGGSGQEQMDNGEMGPCHACGGNGLHTNLFHGVEKPCHGAAPCNHCPGTGYCECNRCSDSGHPGYLVCDKCSGGTLTESCPACDGRGIAVCGNCEGKGTATCPDCNGAGIVE